MVNLFQDKTENEIENKIVTTIKWQVKKERETIRVEYSLKKAQKRYNGRLALPKYLSVDETVIEPSEDAEALLRVFGKELKANNVKLEAAETRVKNLSFKAPNVYKLIVFKGISLNIKRIGKAILDNPEASIWDIVKLFL